MDKRRGGRTRTSLPHGKTMRDYDIITVSGHGVKDANVSDDVREFAKDLTESPGVLVAHCLPIGRNSGIFRSSVRNYLKLRGHRAMLSALDGVIYGRLIP